MLISAVCLLLPVDIVLQPIRQKMDAPSQSHGKRPDKNGTSCFSRAQKMVLPLRQTPGAINHKDTVVEDRMSANAELTRASSERATSQATSRGSHHESDADGDDLDSADPPEIAECSVIAITRLVSKVQELKEIVAMFLEFRNNVEGESQAIDFMSSFYAGELSRSVSHLRRSYNEVQQLRHHGFGTATPSILEEQVYALINKIEGWRQRNVLTAEPQARSEAREAGRSKASTSSGTNSIALVRVTSSADRPFSGNNDGSSRQTTPAKGFPGRNAVRGHQQAYEQPPTEDEVREHFQRMRGFLQAVVAAVHEFQLSREQLDQGVKNMRHNLLVAQKELLARYSRRRIEG